MDPRYMRIEDDSDSSFSCGPTPPNPNNDNDTTCILRLSPDTLQRDPLPGVPAAAAPWAPLPTSSGGLCNLVYDQAFDGQQQPPVPSTLNDVIGSACLPENLESVPPLDLTLPHSEALDTRDVIGNIVADVAADDRPASTSSKETSSEGSAEENLHLLNTPQTETVTDEKLLNAPSIQALEDEAARQLSYQEVKTSDECCPSWNWPLLRNLCVGVNAAIWLGLLAVCIGWIATMPRKCDPFRKWHQGQVMYEIFPGSFQDSDGDGVGDLQGVQSRLYYVKNLQAGAIVLTAMFETAGFPENVQDVVSFTRVDPKLGTAGDFLNLVADAHAMELRVVVALDPVPLLNASAAGTSAANGAANLTQAQQRAAYPQLMHVLEHWLQQGVDGFLLRNLESAVDNVEVEDLVQDARNLLDRYTSGMDDRILIVPLELVRALKAHDRHNATKVLHRVDLLDCTLDIQDQSPQQIADQISEIMSWDESADTPWFTWRLASAELTRLSRRLGRSHTVGATVLQSLLPGTVTLLYGDEVCLMEAEPQENQTLPGLGIMPWSDDVTSADFTLSSRLPWRPLPAEHDRYNALSQQNVSVQSVRLALGVHRSAVPVYVNGIFHSVGDFNPPRSSNLKVRHTDDAVIVLDRFYPRQPRWCAIYNTADQAVTRDLSHIFFRGLVMASSTGDKEGFIRFKELRLEAGEGLLVKLDR